MQGTVIPPKKSTIGTAKDTKFPWVITREEWCNSTFSTKERFTVGWFVNTLCFVSMIQFTIFSTKRSKLGISIFSWFYIMPLTCIWLTCILNNYLLVPHKNAQKSFTNLQYHWSQHWNLTFWIRPLISSPLSCYPSLCKTSKVHSLPGLAFYR